MKDISKLASLSKIYTNYKDRPIMSNARDKTNEHLLHNRSNVAYLPFCFTFFKLYLLGLLQLDAQCGRSLT